MQRILVMGSLALALAGCNAMLGITEGTLQRDAGSAGAAGTAGAAGAGGDTNGENCINGKDDNGNGKIDCADPGCQKYGFTCRTIPSGWSGPIALYLGDYAATPPSCNGAGNYPNAMLTGVSDPSVPAQCKCSCGPVQNLTCEVPRAQVYDNPYCGSGQAGNLVFSGYDAGACVAFGKPDAGTWLPKSANVWPKLSATSGSCTPTKVVVTKPSPWKQKALACSGPAGGWQAGGCASGTMCVPPAPSPFNKGTCIYKSGDVDCPLQSVFSTKFVLYDNQLAADTRDCTACKCGPAQGYCSGKVSLFSSNDTCNGTPMLTLDLKETCKKYAFPPTWNGDYTFDTNQPNVHCPLSGGKPFGGVTPTGTPTTVCCP